MLDPTTNTLNKGQMETKKAKEYLFHTWIKEDYTIKTENGNITALELLEHFEGYLKEEFKKQTTSQQQTIERLREGLKSGIETMDYLLNKLPKDDIISRHEVKSRKSQFEQLLNTTEPIDE